MAIVPWFAEYRSPWAKNAAASRLWTGFSTRDLGGQSIGFRHENQPDDLYQKFLPHPVLSGTFNI